MPPQKVEISNCPAALTTDATDSATLGATPPNNQIRDTATLDIPAGTNGSIEFKLYGPFATAAEITSSSCTAAKLVSGATSTATVTNFNPASPTYNSALFTPTQAGFYNWTAQFTSTTPGVDSTGVFGCGVGLEQSVVNPASPDLTTNAIQQVTIGSPIKDTATLTGATANATGGIKFKLYGPFDASTPASGDNCVDSGAGANLVTTLGPVPIGSPNAQGNYVVESPEYTPTQAGRYQWVASYNGDNNNNAKTSECRAANEASVVEPRAPELTTNATTPVTIDDPISDTATLTGATNDATGTVTFKLYGPFDPDTPASGDTCNETTLVTTLGPVDIGSPNANGDYVVSSGDYTPTEVGRYQWIASYSGDANNGAVSGNCGDANEASVVDKAPANIETAQELFPQDSATLSATAGGTPTGTVIFKLYGPDNPTCSASGEAPVYTESDVTLTNGTANTDNTTFSVDQAKSGNYKWFVTYSGDDDHEDATSECGKEAFTATIDNDTTN